MTMNEEKSDEAKDANEVEEVGEAEMESVIGGVGRIHYSPQNSDNMLKLSGGNNMMR